MHFWGATLARQRIKHVAVQRGDLQATVLSSGALQPAADVALSFGNAGTIAQILVKNGDTVTKGQKLAVLDTRDLQFAVDQAQSNLSSAQAKYDQVKAGAAPKDIANAQSSLTSAQAKLDALKAGPTTEDMANAQAQVTSAQAKLHAAQGRTDAQDMANAQAQIPRRRPSSTAEGRLHARKISPTPRRRLRRRRPSSTAESRSQPGGLANAQAQITSAQAKLDR